jgi:hypothetical protein
MSISSRGRAAAPVLAALVIASACGGGGGDIDIADDSSTSTSTIGPISTTSTTVPLGPIAPLTGLRVEVGSELGEQPAVMVKISNNDDQSLKALTGIDQADVVIEERIEDRATRFAAIFHTNLPEKVGAVRSGRPADIELMANLDNPLFVFSGAFPTVSRDINQFAAGGGAVLVVDDGSGINITRDDVNLNRPDNLFVDLPFVLDKFGDSAGAAPAIFDFLADGATQSSAAVVGDALTVRGRDRVSYVWDPSRGYVRVQDGLVHVTSDGIPLVTDNLVVMETVYTPSSYDPRNVDAHTTPEGPVSVFIGGERFDGTWKRAEATDPYRFEDAAGEPILLSPGRTWLTLVPVGSYEFEVTPEIATLVLEGDG